MILQFPDQKARSTAANEEAAKAILALRGEMDIENRLPFIGPRGPRDGRTGLEKRNFWIDEPTDDSGADHQRGRHYARMTIEAIQERNAENGGRLFTRAICAIDLEHIFEGMICDGIARQKKGGKYSRSVCTSTMSGFLFELGRYIALIRDGS
jgi:hypothetical protein